MKNHSVEIKNIEPIVHSVGFFCFKNDCLWCFFQWQQKTANFPRKVVTQICTKIKIPKIYDLTVFGIIFCMSLKGT